MLEKIDGTQVLTNLMVKSMLNKDNTDFYIGTMTMGKLKQLMEDDKESANVLWNAFCIAQNKFIKGE